ncbi:MAG: DUF4034 domain-containing protein [Pseudomonadota bacterium]
MGRMPFRGRCLVLGLVATVLLPGCSSEEQPPAALDRAADALPVPPPTLESVPTLSGVPDLPDTTRAILDLRQAFFARDFARLDGALLKRHEDYLAGRTNHAVLSGFIDGIQDTQLAGIDACDAWLGAMPASYPAHWVCGAMWHGGAWAARSGKYANEVGYARFALMRERMARSDALLQKAVTLHSQPLQALAMLGANALVEGRDQEGETYLQRAEAILPGHRPIHGTRIHHAQPEWGGSPEQVRDALEWARSKGVGEADLADLEDDYIAKPWRLSTPGAPRAYWEKAIKALPTRQRLSYLLDDLKGLSNWNEALPVADRLIREYPDDASVYYRRGQIHQQLGLMAEARADYRMAAAMGHDLAAQALIMANIRGGLGVTEKSFNTVLELCRYGAGLGSSVGANCLGALYDQGGPAGEPFKRDRPLGLAWHLVGARAGHFNSQFDLGWLVLSGRAPGLDKARAETLGIYWLRRAAEQGQQFAKRKLEERHLSLSEEPEEAPVGWEDYARMGFEVVLAVVRGWL